DNKEKEEIIIPTETLALDSVESAQNQLVENTDSISTENMTSAETSENPSENGEKKGLWDIFILGIGGGLLALMMPCIFPMIPLTVSLFTKQSSSRGQGIFKAMIYGLSIIVIFVGLAFLASKFGQSSLNEFSTNPWVNVGFFVIFVVFAISFFGAFEITLPSKWANFTDRQADKGGYLVIFFMALTLVLISFSCTVPIIAGLIGEAVRTGNYIALTVGSLGFSLALAVPFVLFAIFPSWLTSL